MSAPVTVAFNRDRSRAAFRLFHPKGNILTREMVQALQSALESIEPNPHLKLITIEGDGPDFSFGASVPEHAPDEIARVLPEMHALIERLLDAPAVTAAIVRGRCLGGGFELALACDFIFAAADAVMGLPEIALGVFPPAASALLPVRIGAARATRAIVTGEAHRAQACRRRRASTPRSSAGTIGIWLRGRRPRCATPPLRRVRACRRTCAACCPNWNGSI